MTNPSCIRVSYRIEKITRCHCSAYRYPHRWGVGKCTVNIIENPPVFVPPKKGLGGALSKLLDSYIETENELLDEFISLLKD